MNALRSRLGLLGLVPLLVAAPAAADSLTNPDFAGGLAGWDVTASGATGAPGTVTLDGGQALLLERTSYTVTLAQTFVLPERAETLAFEVAADPGFDLTGRTLPDALDVALVDPSGRPLVPAWQPLSSAFFNLQEDGTVHLGAGTAVDGTRVTVDLSGLAPGIEARLVVTLIGADPDTASGVRLGPFDLGVENQAPVAAIAGPTTLACGAALTLDASGSSDPDGDPLSFIWRDDDGAVLGTEATLTVTPALGARTYRLTVADGEHEVTATQTVTVGDATAPLLGAIDPRTLVADAACHGAVPDLVAGAVVDDACAGAAGVTVTQLPEAGAAVVIGTNEVVVTATDPTGNGTSVTVVVTLVDEAPPTTGDAPPASQVEADASCLGVVPDRRGLLAASDNCTAGAALVVTQSPAPGTPLTTPGTPLTLTFTVADAGGRTASAESTVTLVDTAPPTLTPPGAQSVAADATCAGVVGDVAALAVAVDNCDPAPSVTQDVAADAALILGTAREVGLGAVDAAGNGAQATVAVTLVDRTPPTVAAPEDADVAADAACAGELGDLTAGLVVSDNCAAAEALTVAQSPAAGTALTLGGATTVTLSVTDAAGNVGQATANVNLIDKTPPVIEAPPEALTVAADAGCAGVVGDVAGAVTASDNCAAAGTLTVAQSVPAETALVLGEATPVGVTVTDAAGNAVATSVAVTLVDETPPTVTAPETVVGALDEACAPIVPELTGVTASDNCAGAETLVVAREPAAGAPLAEGAVITLSVSDGAGQTATATVGVTAPPVENRCRALFVSGGGGCSGGPGAPPIAWLAALVVLWGGRRGIR